MMDEKARKEEQIRQEILELIEKDPKAKDYFVEVGSGRVRLSSFLAELMTDPEGLTQFLEEAYKESRGFRRILMKTSGESFYVGIGHPAHLEPLRHFGADTEGMGRFLLALTSGQAGNRLLVKAVAKFKTRVRQVKFECSQEFYKRLMDEKLQRNLTLQQLAVRALKRYLAVPESIHRSLEEEAESTSTPLPELVRRLMQHLSTFIPGLGEERTMAAEAVQLRNALEAVQRYLEQLPLEKVELLRESLALDLKYYRSSRHKRPAQRKGTPEAGSAESEGDD